MEFFQLEESQEGELLVEKMLQEGKSLRFWTKYWRTFIVSFNVLKSFAGVIRGLPRHGDIAGAVSRSSI